MAEAESHTSGDEEAGTATVPAGIRLDPLSRYLKEHVPGAEEPLSIEMIGGGRSNLTYVLRTPGGEWVLRRPPLGHILPTAHDMGREYRFISALVATDVPVPHPRAFCSDTEVIGAPFYIMEYCPGVVVLVNWPLSYGTEIDRARTSAALVTVLARLHTVDWQAVGLGDFTRPGAYLERQLRRLRSQWELSKTQELPAMDEAHTPAQRQHPSFAPDDYRPW